jgi:hypothetical protein
LQSQEIQELNNKVSNLVYQDDFIDLIDIAENKFNYATNAIDLRDDSYDSYDDSVEAEATALEAKSLAQSNLDGQTATVALALEHKDNALEEKDAAQDALVIANINLQTTRSNVEKCWRRRTSVYCIQPTTKWQHSISRIRYMLWYVEFKLDEPSSMWKI